MDKKDIELLTACENRSISDVIKALKKSLLGGSAYINTRGDNWKTALSISSMNGDLEIVKYLIKEGANVNLIDKEYYSPLYYAVDKNHIEIVKALLENGASITIEKESTFIPIERAAVNSCIEIIDLLISYGVDVNSPSNYYNRTPLMLASERGEIEVVEYLLGKGADTNLKSYDGRTAIMYASDEGNIEIVKCLLDNGAIIDEKDDECKSAFDIAYENENFELQKLLNEYNASGSDIQFSGHEKNYKQKMELSVDEMLKGAFLLCPKCKKIFHPGPISLFMAFKAIDNNSSVNGVGFSCRICSKLSSIEEWYYSTLEIR